LPAFIATPKVLKYNTGFGPLEKNSIQVLNDQCFFEFQCLSGLEFR
jgi:hypothetical protein